MGFEISEYFVAVANYDDKSVDVLTKDLKPLKNSYKLTKCRDKTI